MVTGSKTPICEKIVEIFGLCVNFIETLSIRRGCGLFWVSVCFDVIIQCFQKLLAIVAIGIDKPNADLVIFRNDLKLSVGAGLSIASPSNQLLFIRAGGVSDRQLDVEAFPTDVRASHTFTQPYTTIYIMPPLREDQLILGYTLAGETPALEQTRKQVDNRNPLRLRVGNPDLKASLKHTAFAATTCSRGPPWIPGKTALLNLYLSWAD